MICDNKIFFQRLLNFILIHKSTHYKINKKQIKYLRQILGPDVKPLPVERLDKALAFLRKHFRYLLRVQ